MPLTVQRVFICMKHSPTITARIPDILVHSDNTAPRVDQHLFHSEGAVALIRLEEFFASVPHSLMKPAMTTGLR